MLKILALGHSIVKGASDGGEISTTDPRPRPPTPNALRLPEGGWNFNKFQIKPRWGQGEISENVGGPGWTVRAADFLPHGSVQVFNEGYSGGVARNYDPRGDDFLGRIFARADEPVPPDLDCAVIALMANDMSTPPHAWHGSVARVVDALLARRIVSVLVYDWFRGPGVGQYETGDSGPSYRAMCAAAADLIATRHLPPPLDLLTPSRDNFLHGGATWCGDMHAWQVHPNTAGMIAGARSWAHYIEQHGPRLSGG